MGDTRSPDEIPNLWPEDLLDEQMLSPKAIMDRQAAMFTERTDGRLTGTVLTRVLGRDFSHTMYIVAPALGDYQYFLLRIRHPVDALFPLRVSVVERDDGGEECGDLRGFVLTLRGVLNEQTTRELVRVLLAQS